ncbi:DUF6042 family protein [Streptomyces filamentosus]|uniref:DUF6042 family protein n=1 Tax=Streptomyces filamentosus TaxID=67294 RepID=UPI0012389F6B|nr:DUF6042 family protein [Streptomyces filamentosus]KAA6215647.1 hypothetical protein CP979_00600 [Streptomyces filamentosus]
MSENPSVPGQRRNIMMRNDWWATGWEHVLPRQGLPLTMLIGTASQPGCTGSLDDVLQEVFDGHWAMIGGDLEGALSFRWSDEEWDHEEEPEGREAYEARHWEKFGAMLTAAGFPVPRTVRDLSELYLAWGLAGREEGPEGTRWSMPDTLPLPEELLPLDAEATELIARTRWALHVHPLVNNLTGHLIDRLGAPKEILTSLDRLAAATGQEVGDVRHALLELVKSDDARVYRGEEPAESASLEAHQRFRLVMDWDHFHEARVWVAGDTDDGT